MTAIRRLARNFNLLNLLLAGILVLLVSFMVLPRLRSVPDYALPKVKHAPSGAEEQPAAQPEKSHSPADYTIIAEQNLFHPERKIPAEKKAEAPLPKPDFILYGTLITDDVTLAYMEDLKAPQTTPGRGKRQSALSPGDALSGFVLKKVETDRVTMARGEETMVVRLDEPGKPKKRAETAAAQTALDTGQPARMQAPTKTAPQQKTLEAASSVKTPPAVTPAQTGTPQAGQQSQPTFGRFRTLRPTR